MIAQEEYLLLSGIQHFAFCRRQWALITIEGLWADSARTLEGEYMHERAHDPNADGMHGNVVISRGMPVCSARMGVTGACDIVEFHPDPTGVSLFGLSGTYRVLPVEYKRGHEKINDCDRMQLCAQAMCLEEMLLTEIPAGYLYYGETRRREKVDLSDDLRQQVRNAFREMHDWIRRRHTPKPNKTRSCAACSLYDLCIPGLSKTPAVSDYTRAHVLEEDKP